MNLYHGTYIYFDQVDLNNSLDKRDFGMGFYTTTNLEQANKWALKIRKAKFNVIDTYLDGDYTKDEAIKRLKAWKCENQISFHTYKAIKRLKLVRYEYAN